MKLMSSCHFIPQRSTESGVQVHMGINPELIAMKATDTPNEHSDVRRTTRVSSQAHLSSDFIWWPCWARDALACSPFKPDNELVVSVWRTPWKNRGFCFRSPNVRVSRNIILQHLSLHFLQSEQDSPMPTSPAKVCWEYS